MSARAFVEALPKAELHVHLEGAVPWRLVRALAAEPLPARPASWDDRFTFEDFDDLRAACRPALRHCLVSPEGYGRGAGALLEDLGAQNVRYVELSFDGERVLGRGLGVADVVAAIKAAAPPGLIVRVVAGFSYHKPERWPPAAVHTVLGAAGLDGIDLHGDERMGGAEYFAGAFAEARRRGLSTRAHAGELMGPSSIRTALGALGVTRIAHGVRSVEDDGLVKRLAAEGITLDVCPWSNVKLRVVPSLAAHPIGILRDRGVRLTVSSDDPAIFGRSLTDELVSLITELGWSAADVAEVQRTAFDVARVDAGTRARALDEIAGVLDSHLTGGRS
jgi:adenosine deaminase